MAVELDEIIRVGSVSVAALVKCLTHSNAFCALSVQGEKHPVVVFIRRNEVTMAFEIDGCSITLDNVEQRFPGKRDEFERFA